MIILYSQQVPSHDFTNIAAGRRHIWDLMGRENIRIIIDIIRCDYISPNGPSWRSLLLQGPPTLQASFFVKLHLVFIMRVLAGDAHVGRVPPREALVALS